MDEKLKVGIVGTGKFAGHHINVWRSIDQIELVGVHGTDNQRLDVFCQKFMLKGYNDYGRLIEDSDIIDVISANYTHCDYAARALANEKSVIVEKPLDIVYEKATMLYKLSEDKGVIGSVISQFRFQRSFQDLKSILDAGQLGSIEMCRLCVVWPRNEDYFNRSGGWKKDKSRVGGGVLMHQCIHFIDLLHWFFGGAISVIGRKDCNNPQAVERSFWGEIEFEKGAVCQLYLTTKPLPYFYNKLEVFGTKGTVVANGNHILKKTNNNYLKNLFDNAISYMIRTLKGPENSNTLLRRQFLNIIDAILTGTLPLVTIKDGLIALGTVLGLYQASECGERIYLDNLRNE